MKTYKLLRNLLVVLALGVTFGCSGSSSQNTLNNGPVNGKKTAKVLSVDQQMTTNLSDQSQPAVAFDTYNHQYLTVWTDSRNTDGSTDIYGRISSGKSLFDDGTYDPITKTGGLLAYDNDPLVQPNAGFDQITGKPLGYPKIETPPMTLKGTADIPISVITSGTGAQFQPKVAFYPDTAVPANSKYLVIWTDSSNVGWSQIYGQFLKADGTYLNRDGVTSSATQDNFPISAHVGTGLGTVSVAGSTSVPVSNGTVAISQGSATVTGSGTTFVDSGIVAGDIFIIAGVAYGVQTTPVLNTSITLTSTITGFPAIPAPQSASGLSYHSYRAAVPTDVITGNGTNFIADQVHAGDMINVNGVYYEIKIVDSATKLTLTTLTANSSSGTGLPYSISAHKNQTDPDIIYNPVTRKFVVAWLDTSNIDTNHTAVIQGATCSNAALVNYIPHPIVDDNVIYSTDVNPGNGSIGFRKPVSTILSLGQWGDSGSSVTAMWSAQLNESKPKLTFDSSTGDIYAVWNGISETVTMTVDYTKDASPATTCTYKNALFVASNQDTTPKVKLRQDGGLGQVKDLSFGTDTRGPTLATNPNTNLLLIAWEDNNGGTVTGKNVQGQLVDLTSFTPNGNIINISNAIGDQSSPAASYDNTNQRFFVAWEDARNQSANISNMDIYGQFIDPQGNLSGGNTIITVAPSNQVAPAIVFGDAFFRKFLVVWSDGRLNNNSDIYAQLLEYSTAPQLVITDSLGIPILNGAIDFGNVDISMSPPYKDIQFKVRNDGNAQLTINSISDLNNINDLGNPYSYITPKPVTISPGSSADMTIRFAPTSSGSFSGDSTNNYKMVFNSNGGNAVIYLSGAGVGNLPLSIASTILKDGSAGDLYTATITAIGGNSPYRNWTVPPGQLPDGLKISTDKETGLISGRISSLVPQGVYPFTVSVTDSSSPTPFTATAQLSIRVTSISIDNTSFKPWTQGTTGYSETLMASNISQPVVWSVGGGNLPPGLFVHKVNPLDPDSPWVIEGTPTSAGTFNFSLNLKDGSLPGQANKVFSISINPELFITTSSFPGTVVGTNYSQPLALTGGTPSFTWSIETGSLPNGLFLNPNTGVISGIPTSVKDTPYTFTVKVTDGVGASAIKALSIKINPVLDIATAAGSLTKEATSGALYTFNLEAGGGSGIYTWSIVPLGGALPSGLTLNPFTGQVTGTPTVPGNFPFTVQVQDTNGNTKTKSFIITVSDPLLINTTTLSPWTKDVANYFSLTGFPIQVQGGKKDINNQYAWAIISGSLPAGLQLGPTTGIIKGTPSVATTSSFIVQVTDANGATKTQSLTLLTNQVLSIITTSANLPTATPNALYNKSLAFTGGTSPFVWTATPGTGTSPFDTIPAGLNVDALGVISGIVDPLAESGLYTFTVQVLDNTGATTTRLLTIEVVSPLEVSSATLAQGIKGVPYNKTLSATGGRTTFFWSLVSPTVLPPGLTLSSNGLISGTPTTGGTYNFDVLVTDRDGRVATKSLAITISDPAVPPSTVIFQDPADFGNVFVSDSSTITVNVRNNSSNPITIVSVESSKAAFFPAPVLLSGFILAPNASKPIDITFNPSAIAQYSGDLTLTDSLGNRYKLSLSGIGTPVKVVKTAGTATLSQMTPLQPVQLPVATKPASFTPTSAASFVLTGVTSTTVTMAVTFDGSVMPTTPVFYMINRDGAWVLLIAGTDYALSGNTVTYTILDNDTSKDLAAATGTINNLIIVGSTGTGTTPSTGGTGGAASPPSSGGKSGCFIATAAYGSYLDPHVVVLRNFRDNFLLKSELGTAFVRFYYAYSPPIADFIQEHVVLRTATRWMLTPLIFAVEYSLAAFAGTASLVLCGFVLYRRNRKIA